MPTLVPVRAVCVRTALFVGLLAGAATAPEPASAQAPSPADSAAVLLATASDFEGRGEGDIAQALYRHIADRFRGTPAAETALARLDAAVAASSRGAGRDGTEGVVGAVRHLDGGWRCPRPWDRRVRRRMGSDCW